MCAIAKWFFGGCAAATKRHPFFIWKPVAFGVDQFHFACHHVRAVLDCFDFYVSHGGNTKASNPKSKFTAANPSDNNADSDSSVVAAFCQRPLNFEKMNRDFSIQSKRNIEFVRFLQLSLCHP